MGKLFKNSSKLSGLFSKKTSQNYTGVDPMALPKQGDYGQSGTGDPAKTPRRGRGNMGPIRSPLST